LSAKHKLNSAHFVGALVIAGLMGGMTESWTVFSIALAGLLVADVLSGSIRR
jgi:hypothetical protein